MFAIIKTGGKQYKVKKDDRLVIDTLGAKAGDTVSFDVLMTDGKIGTPTVPGAKVQGKVVELAKTDKVIVFKKKRRHNYRRLKGHREQVSVVQITDIKA